MKAARKLVKGWNMKLIYTDDFKNEAAEKELGAKKVSLDELARTADVVSLHCPLTETTKNIINADFLNKVKKNLVLVNTARGDCVH
jgi:lactate dehydrogenase-like 2-hydroxyacid dehydrogenase